MDVYVESNFVLELALLQEQQESCESIVGLCESGEARLILPAYSLVEPYETLVRYEKNRKRLSNDLASEVKQLARSKPYKEDIDDILKITGFLVRSQEEETERLKNTLSRLLKTAEVVPLTLEILSAAMTYQIDHGLTPSDSVVYASVLEHLSASISKSKCFLKSKLKGF